MKDSLLHLETYVFAIQGQTLERFLLTLDSREAIKRSSTLPYFAALPKALQTTGLHDRASEFVRGLRAHLQSNPLGCIEEVYSVEAYEQRLRNPDYVFLGLDRQVRKFKATVLPPKVKRTAPRKKPALTGRINPATGLRE